MYNNGMIRNSIFKKNILRTVILGLVIFIVICFVAGAQFFNEVKDYNRSIAHSYLTNVFLAISVETLEDVIDDGDEIADAWVKLDPAPDRALDSITEEEREAAGMTREQSDLLDEWMEVNDMLYDIFSYDSSITSFQIIVPNEEDVLILWYADRNYSVGFVPMKTHRPYHEGEREMLSHMINESVDDELYIYHEDGHSYGTSAYPLFDSSASAAAFMEIDISIDEIVNSILTLMGSIAIIFAVCMVAVFILDFFVFKKQIIRPVTELKEMSEGVVDRLKNEYDAPVITDIHTGDEIESLAHSFEDMVVSLKSYIKENTEMTAEKKRISTELELASEIQSGRLPSVFPPFPDRKEFDIFASMTPAKEVGGDFYDFFLVNENTLGLVMADVSGKGIPAALFMMEAMITIENMAAKESGPAAILDRVNQALCANNKNEMFVTVWLGFLDLKSGLLKAANGGHLYPILQMPGKPFEEYKDKHSFMVGVRKKTTYKEYELTLLPGSRLFLYTDGVTEARDAGDNMFRIQRTLDALNQAADGTPEELLHAVQQSISEFTKDAEQFDDLTMMCLHYHGADPEDLHTA